MMRTAWIVALAAGVALSAAPAQLSAQGASATARAKQQDKQQAKGQQKGQQTRAQQVRTSQDQQRRDDALRRERDRIAELERQREWERQREADRRRDVYGRDVYDRDVYGRQQARNGGPAFCRSGAGHPVKGRQWCRDKGWALGNERWDRRRMDDIIFGDTRRRYEDRMGRSVLQDVLGDVIFRRFETMGRQYGGGEMYGRWLDDGYSGRSMQLSVAGIPFAELVDTNRDGRVDQVLLRR
jgi:hypothetical protein